MASIFDEGEFVGATDTTAPQGSIFEEGSIFSEGEFVNVESEPAVPMQEPIISNRNVRGQGARAADTLLDQAPLGTRGERGQGAIPSTESPLADVPPTVIPTSNVRGQGNIRGQGAIDSEVERARDLVTTVENVHQLPLTSISALWGSKEGIEHINQIKQRTLREVVNQGINAWQGEDGSLYMETNDGQVEEIDSSMLAHIWKAKITIGASIAGAAAGAAAGMAAAPNIPVPQAFVASKAAGAFIGAAAGSYAATVAAVPFEKLLNQMELIEKISAETMYRQMREEGIVDLIGSVVGVSLAAAVPSTVRGVKKAFDMLGKNKEGAIEALTKHTGISKDEAYQLVDAYEAKLGKLEGMSPEEKAIYVVTTTQPGGEAFTAPARIFNPYAESEMKQQVVARAKSVLDETAKLSYEKPGEVLIDALNNYVTNVKSMYANVKAAGAQIAPESFKFEFDEVAIEPILQSMKGKIHNPVQLQRFENTLTNIRNASTKRDFESLIDLRQELNSLKSQTKIADIDEIKALNDSLKSIDSEISNVVKDMPGEGKWQKLWENTKAEYSTMKKMEDNVLYKALQKPGLTEDMVKKTLTRYIRAMDNTFYEVMEKLPSHTKAYSKLEGTVLDFIVNMNTVGVEGGVRAIHFPQLSQELKKAKWKSGTNQQVVRAIHSMAEIFKNDVNLLRASNFIEIPKFQSYLTTDPVVRLKFELASSIFNGIKSRLPTEQADALALVRMTGDVLDNPLKKASLDKFKRAMPQGSKQLRDAPRWEQDIKQLQQEFHKRKTALEAMYGGKDIPARLVWKKPLEAETTMIPSDDIMYATAKAYISKDPNKAILAERTDDLIADFIWSSTKGVYKSEEITRKAAAYLDNKRFEGVLKSARLETDKAELQDVVNMLHKIINREADILIKRINKDFGVQLPPKEADKIIKLKFAEYLGEC